MAHFTKETFAYFKEASRQERDQDWFVAHKTEYEEAVARPFAEVIGELRGTLSHRLPGIDFSPRRISRAVKRNAGLGESSVRTEIRAYFATTSTSQFEMNPGVYLSLGAKDDDSVVGLGLYMPSSRQMHLLRPKLMAEYKKVRQLLGATGMTEYWGGLSGERYVRFPKGFDEKAAGAEFLWHKQFFLSHSLPRRELMRSDFSKTLVAGVQAGVPFLNWMRDVVGVYRRPGPGREEF